MILFYNKLKKKIFFAAILSASFFMSGSCQKEADYNPPASFFYPMDVEISGYIYDKDTSLPLDDIKIILEVYGDRNYLAPVQVETEKTDEDGHFSIDISASTPHLKLKASGAPAYKDGEIKFYLTPDSMQYDSSSNEYIVGNQFIYLEKI